MGKLLVAARAEIHKCAWVCRHYAEHAEEFLADEVIKTDALRGSFVRFQPIGPILAVMPWNFPFWQVFRFAAPALMTGNVCLLKHASNVPGCALAIEQVFREAEFPLGAFQSLLIGSDQVSDLISDSRVKAATLTGSEQAGSSLAKAAGEHVKKTVLELGGSDPFIVMPTADLDEALQTAVEARMINNGQSCIAAKRFIVAEAVADEFEHRFVNALAQMKVGDPTDQSVQIGPLASQQVLETLEEQVRRSVNAGARVLIGGHRLEGSGFYYLPTALRDVPKESPVYSEEVFGPVASLFRVHDLDEAIVLANDTKFGLGASVWTRDEREQARSIDNIEAGSVFINGLVKSDPRLPFGGTKNSGYGRELGVYGMREFVNAKTVWVG
jgi:succinate-semialdehyde dehydrogenase/glutarate-semialdehyde dehydrogenase